MRRFLPALLLLFAPLAFAQNQTIVTGTITDPSGIPYYPATVSACLTPATLYPMVAGQQVNNNPGTNYCFGPVSTASNGSFLMSLWGNALITCSPVCPSTQWLFTVVIPGPVAPVGFGPQQFTATITISGNTQDIGATLNAAGVSQLRPAGAATNATNLVGPGAITGSFSGTHTESGNVIHSGTDVFKNINNIRFADQFAGADCGAKINAADADLGGVAGEIWANIACGTTWTTAVSISANHVLRFTQYANYTTSATVTLNGNHAGIMCDGPQIATTPLCAIVEANGANLPALVLVSPGADGAFLRDIMIFGNHGPGNQTAGVCIKVDRSKRFSMEDSTVASCQTHAIWIHSTGTNNESAAPKLFRVLIGSAFGDGLYVDNTADGWFGPASESGNNGLQTGASARPLVSTTNTTITYASGGPLTGWSTDTSLVGTMLRVNDSIRCQVLAVPSTTTITVSATQCWNINGTITALGTLTNVPLNWGNGIELNTSPTWRIVHNDFGVNAMDGILGYALASGGLTNGETEITGGNQAGGNLQNGIEVIGYDTVGAGITNSGWMITGNTINGGTNGPVTPTWANVLLVDPQGVTVVGNTFNTSGSPQAKYAISVVESAAGRAGTVYAAANIQNGQSASFASGFYNDSTQNGAIGLQIPCRIGITGALDLFDITAGAVTPHSYICNASGLFTIRNNAGNNILQIDQSGNVFGIGIFLPNTPGTQLGTAGNPFGPFFIGTAATNNFKFQPATTTGARIWAIPDWGANGAATQNQPFVIALTSQYTNSTTTFSNVAGGNTIQFAVAANSNYTATCHLYYQAAATGGLNIEFTGPASPTAVRYGMDLPTAITGVASGEADAFGTSIGAVSTAGAVNLDAMVSFSLLNGANAGTVNLLAKSSAAVQLQIQSGSWCRIQ